MFYTLTVSCFSFFQTYLLEAHLKPSQTFAKEFFWRNSQQVLAVNYFFKKATTYMFEWVLTSVYSSRDSYFLLNKKYLFKFGKNITFTFTWSTPQYQTDAVLWPNINPGHGISELIGSLKKIKESSLGIPQVVFPNKRHLELHICFVIHCSHQFFEIL